MTRAPRACGLARYRDRDSVAAYDVINESYGDYTAENRPRLRETFVEIYTVIREVDPGSVVVAPATRDWWLSFYGAPKASGWK